jgi:hypothetical protein
VPRQVIYVAGMTYCCAYCGRPATAKVPTVRENVCATHALEFWTGLLAYAVGRDADVTREPTGACELSNEVSTSARRFEPRRLRLAS